MSATDTVTTRARELAQRFVDAFNARDAETLREIVADDAAFRALSGGSLRGHDGLRALLQTAEERDLRLVPLRRAPTVEHDGDKVLVKIPIRELIGPDDIERTAEFEVVGERIAAFAVRPFE
jgi:ketosteroid isomerase-like protein